MQTSKETCSKKRSFSNRNKALNRAEQLGMSVYECNICNKYHLTSLTELKRLYVKNHPGYTTYDFIKNPINLRLLNVTLETALEQISLLKGLSTRDKIERHLSKLKINIRNTRKRSLKRKSPKWN